MTTMTSKRLLLLSQASQVLVSFYFPTFSQWLITNWSSLSQRATVSRPSIHIVSWWSGRFISYGVDTNNLFERAAAYVDRILKGAKPTELPVKARTKFELVINRKTAKALGLDVPSTLLARAEDVLE